MDINPTKAINIHRITPWSKGLAPTAFKEAKFKVAPIKNKVMVKPILATPKIVLEKTAIWGT